ncbi:MAG: hypothetical protein LJE94_12765 [Deltaproteobacteria bacterium]|nr:hypothetical protein [Deltaproteobacteria bacterium]
MSTTDHQTNDRTDAGKTGIETVIRKMSDAASAKSAFLPEDYQRFAAYFDIEEKDAEQIAVLFSGCFGTDGRFLRDAFEKRVPELSRYDRKIFEICWHYFKKGLALSDRVAFLNSMQLLIVHLKQPKKALKVLLNDFVGDPDHVTGSDRDALMLSNLLVRKYNKELHTDIETTPEEVLLVINGLDTDVTQYAQWRLESLGGIFTRKVGTIGAGIAAAVDAATAEPDGLTVEFLLSLDREVIIFLSLVGGDIAHRIIQSAVESFGDPDSRIFHLSESLQCLPLLLQHLKILIRGLGRVGGKQDIALLKAIKAREKAFILLKEDRAFHGLVRQALQWADISMDRAAAKPAG